MLNSFGNGSQRIGVDRPMSPYNKQKLGYGVSSGNNSTKKRVSSNKRAQIPSNSNIISP